LRDFADTVCVPCLCDDAWVRIAVAAAASASIVAAHAAPAPAAPPTAAELVGSRLVVAMSGTAPSGRLLRRVRRGEVAGVILFGRNVVDEAQVARLAARLQAAARAAGRPPVLVAVDQEGGVVRRLGWAPPRRSAAELGALTPAESRAEGRATGRALRRAGVNVDLAPVADVPGPGSFMAADRRAFSADAGVVAAHVTAFARGLADAGVAATAKHFPGIGDAAVSTDRAAVEIPGGRAALAGDLVPFRRAIAAGVPLVMLANADYAAFRGRPGWAAPISTGLLRRGLGFRGVSITDALDAAALTRGWELERASLFAAQAGVDLLLVTGSETAGARVFRRLLRAAADGSLPRRNLERSHRRVLVLRAALG
jgi:beta-N-acetylhexosaminidase